MPDNTPPTPSTPTVERLLEIVDSLAGQPVAVVADLVVDRFIRGTPKRVSREAPVLILRHDEDERRPGGGANAIANVAALGGSVLPVGILGEDENGVWLREHLAEITGRDAGLLRRARFRTPTKTRVLGGAPGTVKQQIVRFDSEDHLELTREEIESIVSGVVAAQPRVVLLSDYGYGAVTPALASRLRAALPGETAIVCDSRFRLAEYDGVNGATPNLEEVQALVAVAIDSDATLYAAGRHILETTRMAFLLITRGSGGMVLFSDGHIGSIPVHGTDQVADVTGAGDTVIGTLALALAAGASPLEASLVANFAGGIVVMKAGTATLDRGELYRAIESDPLPLEGLKWVAS